MTSFRHITVLQAEAVEALAPAPGRCVVDATLGGGGHSERLLERGARVVGVDQDPAALAAASQRLARFGAQFTAAHANFRTVRAVLDALGLGLVDGLLADLGVSSPQLDEAQRGFSFAEGGPLDMRMDPTQGEPLSEWLARVDERELSRAIAQYGEEPAARRVAREVKRALAAGQVTDTRSLAAAVVRGTGPRHGTSIHPATKTFQALRIAVNDELGALEALLAALPELVAPGGRACIIAFHSLEDRPVKQRFAELSRGCICPPDLPVCGCGRTAGWRLVTRRAVQASEAEVEANPRSRSARLRCIERLAA